MEDYHSLTKPLGRWPVIYYGVGHMLNDITASCWFTYLLVFLTDIGLTPRDAAIVMLSGQIADAFGVMFVGELIDRFGRFKLWHAGGSVLVAVSFSSVFGGCMPCKLFGSSSLAMETVAYSTFAAIFNLGWAATQVSHMSMLNCITLNSTWRVVLASCRNAFTMVANLSLYAIAFIVFQVLKANTHDDIENQYRWIAYLSIFVGCCFVVIFHLGTTIYERRTRKLLCTNSMELLVQESTILPSCYCLCAQQTNNQCVTVCIPCPQAYLAFYVIDEMKMAMTAKALVPGIIYVLSFIVSVVLQEMAWNGQRLKAYYSAGCILWMFCGAGILVLPSNMNGFMYIISIFIGIANALMTVTAVSMQSVLVGTDLNGCAFVCGSLSFMDKMSCGIAVYILQSYQTSSPMLLGSQTLQVYMSVTRFGLGVVPAFCSVAGIAVTYSMKLDTPCSKPYTEALLG